jgi:hypothetical protein
MKKFIRHAAVASLGIFVTSQIICHAVDNSKPTQAEGDALMAMIHVVNHTTLPYKMTAMQQMLEEANYFCGQLKLPIKRPIQTMDVQDGFISSPWHSVIHATNYPYFPKTTFGRDIANTNIPIKLRIHALQFAVSGRIDTANFEFGFGEGKLLHIMRLDSPQVEYYARRLDELVGKPSLIDTNGAYQLATQWLAGVDVDMTAMGKLKWTVNQLHYRASGATNYVTLPLYYVDFGNKHCKAAGPNLKDFDEPLVSVEVLGTTKELQELMINDVSLSRRPLLLITNALDLVRTPNPPMEHLEKPLLIQTNSP